MTSKFFIFNIGVLFYSILAALVSVILILLGSKYKKNGEKVKLKMMLILMFIIILPTIIYSVAWVDAKYIEPNWIRVRKVTVKSKSFASAFKDIRIVHISDLHIEKQGYREKKLVQIIKRLNADVIFITGDFISSAAGLSPCLETLRELRAKKGIYAILGNHDYYYLSEKNMINHLKNIGIIVLRYENVRLDFAEKGAFWLVGLSDKYGTEARYGNESYISAAFQGIPLEDPKIMIIHNPEVANLGIIYKYNPQLILAGHTHGGQFGIAFLRKYSWYAERSEYMEGMHTINGVPLYVNRGIGMITRNMRLFCRPEVTCIKLTKI